MIPYKPRSAPGAWLHPYPGDPTDPFPNISSAQSLLYVRLPLKALCGYLWQRLDEKMPFLFFRYTAKLLSAAFHPNNPLNSVTRSYEKNVTEGDMLPLGLGT